jgi:hypothetical protein
MRPRFTKESLEKHKEQETTLTHGMRTTLYKMQGLVKDAPATKAAASSKKVRGRRAHVAQHLTRANVPSAYSMADGNQARAAIIQEAIKNIVMDNKNHASRCSDPAAKRQKISPSSTEIAEPHFLCFGTEVMTQSQAGFDFANWAAMDIRQANGISPQDLQNPCPTHEARIAQDGGTGRETHENKSRMLGTAATASVDIPEYFDSAHDVLHAMCGSRHDLVDQLALNTTASPSQSHDQPFLRHVVIVPDSPSSDTSTQPLSRGETPWPQHGEAMPSEIISLRLERDALRSALEMSRMREESSLQMLQELRSQLLEAYRIMGRGVFA